MNQHENQPKPKQEYETGGVVDTPPAYPVFNMHVNSWPAQWDQDDPAVVEWNRQRDLILEYFNRLAEEMIRWSDAVLSQWGPLWEEILDDPDVYAEALGEGEEEQWDVFV